MTIRMLITADEEESRVALVQKRRLENLEIEAVGGEGRRGNVYKGIVHKVEQSLQAAFIDFGEEKQGFLPLTEIHRRMWPEALRKEKRPDITKILREKQELMVQVVKDEIGTKGATLTTYVSLPGRYLVLMPETEKHGISRRLNDTERRRLKETIDSIGVPEGFGVIIRTAGQQQRPLELKKDLLYLSKLYDSIEEQFAKRRQAGLIYKDRSHAVRFIRDYFSDDVDEVWCDNRSVLKEISEFMSVLMPDAKSKLRLYEAPAPLFVKFGVEDQIESVFAREVQLPNGGSIVLDQTEALVAIDVNSGRVKGEDIEETALKTNLEAADEVARQVKIRDLGGLLVIDFIDMRDRKNNRAVEQRLRAAFEDDKAKIKFGRISAFGLMELSRQRLRKSLAASITRRCQACDGTGRVRASGSAALSLLRRIEEACLRGNVKYIRATAPVSIANLLLNRRRREMIELESKLGSIVEVVGHKDMPANLVALDVVVMKGGRSGPQRIYQLLDLVRNQVVRKDSSPLPRPEAGLEALELDHTAIYRAIEERDAALRAEEELAENYEFDAVEPDFSQDDTRAESKTDEKEERRRKRKRRKRRDRDGMAEARAQTGLEVEAEFEAPPKPAPAEAETVTTDLLPHQEERKAKGFVAWMKRIFGVGDEEGESLAGVSETIVVEDAPALTGKTAAAAPSSAPVADAEEVSSEAPRGGSRRGSESEDDDGSRRKRRRRGRGRGKRDGQGTDDQGSDSRSQGDRSSNKSEASSTQNEAPAQPTEGESSGGSEDEGDGSDEDGSRRRRRRGGRRRRGRSEEEGAEGSEGTRTEN
ncbi:MAG: ribonuclease E, partial [Myxococcota bacterium]